MTKNLHNLPVFFAQRIVAEGGPQKMDAVTRDAWASLSRWHQAEEPVWRIADDDEAPELADDLPLASAPVFAPGVCYSGPQRDEWILVARHQPREVVRVARGTGYAFPEPMITYLTIAGETPAAGCLNLIEQPTWGSIYLPAGKRGSAWLQQDDIAVEEKRFHRALRHWFRPPTIVA